MKIIILFISLCFLNGFAQDFEVGDQELLLMPTAYTMPQGKTYFADYELFFLNLTHAFTSRTHVGLFTFFPVTSEFLETASFGLKQNVYRSKKLNFAVWGSYTPNTQLFLLGGVASIGTSQSGFHLGVGLVQYNEEDEKDSEPLVMLGYMKAVSERATLLFEYFNSQTAALEGDFNGLLNFGVRFKSGSISWELGALRPLEDTDDLLFIPLLKAIIYF
jgi:hypothetical protein